MQYIFGDYTLDTQHWELRYRGRAVPLRPQTFDLLLSLVTHHDRAIAKQELLAQLWPYLHVSPATLSAGIKLARQAVGDSGAVQGVIQTLHGRGYRFVAPVEARDAAPPAAQHPQALSASMSIAPVTARPGMPPPWGAQAAVTQLVLPPLRTVESQAVVQAVPGTAHLPAALQAQIVARAAGNPFFLEELARHAVERRGATTPVRVPETVHAALAARIDRLAPTAKHLLETAAVLGLQMTTPLLQAVLAWADAEFHTGLQELQAAELLYETQLVPVRTYTFKHALTQEVAYNSLLRQGVAAVAAAGHTQSRPLCLLLLAEVAGQVGQVEDGLQLLAEARTALEANGQGDLLAEAYRLQGTLLLHLATPDGVRAAASFQQACTIARHQGAKAWELRAALGLSRLWQQQYKRQAAYDLLAPLYGWFTEGFDTTDLQEAKALLEELAG